MKTPTQTVEVEGIKIEIPTGNFATPTARAIKLVEFFQNRENWKLPVSRFSTDSLELADEYAYALDFYMGGHEREEILIGDPADRLLYVLTSRGYYHYVGA